jgi:hypothetical protein
MEPKRRNTDHRVALVQAIATLSRALAGLDRRRAGASTLLLAVVLLVCFAAPAAAVERQSSDHPRAVVLYGDLLLSVFPTNILPAGYVITGVQKYPISAVSRRHHAVGAVVVNLNLSHAGIIYTVFPNDEDLQARWRDDIAGRGQAIVVDAKLAKGRQIDGWTSLDGHRVGVTDIVFRAGNVLVSALTTSSTHHDHGNRADALRLARAGLIQLRRLDR